MALKTVIMNVNTSYKRKRFNKGQQVTQPDNIADRWIRRGIAHYPIKSKTISTKLTFEPIKFSKPTSIIILTVNNIDLLKRCLDSIHKYTGNYELVIIGNNPTDEVKKYLKGLDKFNLKLVINKENKGFPYGCNQGIKIAKYNYLCFLNDDTAVTPNWLYRMQKTFEVKKDCGFSSPTTCYSNGKQCDWNLAKDRFNMSEAGMLEYSSKLKEEYIQTEISGFCVLTKKKILDKVGVFDWHKYKLGNTEEIDLQWRAEKSGYKSYWTKWAYVHHFGHATFNSLKIDPYNSVRKNRQIFEERKKDKNLFIENDVKVGRVKECKIKKHKKVNVVIPVLDRKEETVKTLKSLFKNNTGIDVWIVDNGSKDISYLSDFKVRIIKNKDNLGTVKAINQGLKFCQSEYIVVMHNDIVVNTKDWISKSVKFMKKNNDIGIVGVAGWKKLRKNGIPDWGTVITAIDKYNRKPKDFAEASILDGSCNVIRNLGLQLDEIYGLMHYYDLDLSMQYKQRGYRLFVMDGSAEHFAEDPGKSTRANKDYLNKIGMADSVYYQKNGKIFLDKWKNYLPMEV